MTTPATDLPKAVSRCIQTEVARQPLACDLADPGTPQTPTYRPEHRADRHSLGRRVRVCPRS